MGNRVSTEVTISTDSPAISTSDMKDFLRVTGSDDDAIIGAYVASATEAAKMHLRRAILTETFVMRMDRFSDIDADKALDRLGAGTHLAHKGTVLGAIDEIELPYMPIQSITSVVTYDDANNSSTFDSASYLLDGQGGRLILNDGYTWPTDLRDSNAVEITFVAGYGSGNIPAPILEAIRMMVANMYEGCQMMNEQVKALLAPYKLVDVMGIY